MDNFHLFLTKQCINPICTGGGHNVPAIFWKLKISLKDLINEIIVFTSINGTSKGKITCHQKFGLSTRSRATGLSVRLRDFENFENWSNQMMLKTKTEDQVQTKKHWKFEASRMKTVDFTDISSWNFSTFPKF